MRRTVVLNGHPLKSSFNGALADRYTESLQAEGVMVDRLDLSDLTVPDLMTRSPGDAEMTGDIAHVWRAFEGADHVVIVHPLWWGGMPGKLKALFDVLLQSGKAYRYNGRNPLPEGLLKGRSARLIVTSDTPHWFMVLGYCSAHFRAVKNQILGFIGLKPVRVTHLSVMRGATLERRERLLARADRAARSDAKRLMRGRVADRVPASA